MFELPCTVKLAGVSFGSAQANIKTYGSPDIRWFALVREPDNPHDPNAIRVALSASSSWGTSRRTWLLTWHHSWMPAASSMRSSSASTNTRTTT